MGDRVNLSGLVVAGLGFFLTRFTVTLAIYEEPVRFYLAGIVPLALGLGLAAFGVALTVADVDRRLVRTTAIWSVIGAGTMLVLVVLTLIGSTASTLPDVPAVRSRTYLSNFLIGGSVGGTLTGLYAARNRRQRAELRHQANRLQILNRFLRHEILNAMNVITGRAVQRDDAAWSVIEEYSKTISETIDDVKFLTGSAGSGQRSRSPVDLQSCLDASVQEIRTAHPAADITVESPAGDVSVYANERLHQVFEQLLENAVVHSPQSNPSVAINVEPGVNTVRVSLTDNGPGLPEHKQKLLEAGVIQEFDDPASGFGLHLVRFLVEDYGGRIETAVTQAGSSITVVLQRAGTSRLGFAPTPSRLTAVRPAIPHLFVIFAAALVAGLPYGIISEHLGGSVAAIGVFYGIGDPLVGWLTHEFHSVVFGFVFAGLVANLPQRYEATPLAYVAVGVGWGVVLWTGAASIIAPIWLQLLGIEASVPNFSIRLLYSHLAWGITLGLGTFWGYRNVIPWLIPILERSHLMRR